MRVGRLVRRLPAFGRGRRGQLPHLRRRRLRGRRLDGGAPEAPPPATCGNGTKDPGEICDGADLGGLSCDALGLGGGDAGCAANCLRLDTSGCESGERPPPAGCGDGEVGEGEVCDGANLNGASCETLGLEPGTLRCGADCGRYDPRGCGGGGCEPACGARVCGPEPTCGTSCGVCNEGACDANGQCQVQRDPTAPQFLQFGTNVQMLHEGDTAVFTAVLTDADGIDDLIGGTLLDADTGASLGSFQSAAQEGSYSLRLSWDELHTARAINVGPAGELRTFRAEFFDQGGLRTRSETQIRLRCRAADQSACDGRCYDLQTETAHCGQCNNNVAGQGVVCRGGVPACGQEGELRFVCGDVCVDGRFDAENCGRCGKTCRETHTDFADCRASEIGGCLGEFVTQQRTRCSQFCPQAVQGGQCPGYDEPGRALYGAGAFDFVDVGCDEVPPADDGGDRFVELHCYCKY